MNAEARRVLAVSISKLYASRSQRGGLRLHRSLLLSLVMKSARDIYHSSRETDGPVSAQPSTEDAMDACVGPREPKPGHPEPQTVEPTPVEEDEDSGRADEGCDGENTVDKENQSPSRQSRKRRGKAAAAPDFLPSKRARLEPGEERYGVPVGSCRTGAGDSLSALSLNQVIPAF